jgi:hypothetical protein
MVPRSDMALAGRRRGTGTAVRVGVDARGARPCEVSVRLFTKASAKANKAKGERPKMSDTMHVTVCAHTVRLLRVVRYVPAVRTVEAIEVAHHIGDLLPCGG